MIEKDLAFHSHLLLDVFLFGRIGVGFVKLPPLVFQFIEALLNAIDVGVERLELLGGKRLFGGPSVQNSGRSDAPFADLGIFQG